MVDVDEEGKRVVEYTLKDITINKELNLYL